MWGVGDKESKVIDEMSCGVMMMSVDVGVENLWMKEEVVGDGEKSGFIRCQESCSD